MDGFSHKAEQRQGRTFLSRLRRDVAGNTLAMLAIGLFPLFGYDRIDLTVECEAS